MPNPAVQYPKQNKINYCMLSAIHYIFSPSNLKFKTSCSQDKELLYQLLITSPCKKLILLKLNFFIFSLDINFLLASTVCEGVIFFLVGEKGLPGGLRKSTQLHLDLW